MAFSAPRCIDKLKGRIEDSLVPSISGRCFLPTDGLHEILTPTAIKDAVAELPCGEEHRIRLADAICREGKRVFAMLIYNGWQDHITTFCQHNALDERLPLSEDDAVEIVGLGIGRRLAREQWAFCPYTFPEKMWVCHCQVEENLIIPFISAETIGLGFSTVEKIGISPSQHNFMDKGMKTVYVIREKVDTNGNTEDFNREVRHLELLHELRHPNIIPFLGSYTYGEEQNFLFSYNIDMDLSKFLSNRTRHQDFQWDFTFYSALAGLASALSKTHGLFLDQVQHGVGIGAIDYPHGLRPPNVFVRADTFILVNFGPRHLKRAETLSRTRDELIGMDYSAPDCARMRSIPKPDNRAIDVWAFGCLMTEVITYILKEANGVDKVRRKREAREGFPRWDDVSFCQPGGAIKQDVIDWMEALRHGNPSQDLIPQLIEISLDALQPDPYIRPSMNIIHQRLAILSMQKHFQSVNDMFHETQRLPTPLPQNHLECPQWAQKRFEVWGYVLALNKDRVSTQVFEISDRCVRIMKSLLDALRKESQKQALGDSSGLVSLSRLIVHKVEELWESLPDDMLQSARQHWKELVLGTGGLSKCISSPNLMNRLGVPVTQPELTTDALRLEFEEVARLFKDDLPDSVPFIEISRITTIGHVYDITNKIQADQHSRGSLRNLARIQPYLERLTGYVNVINDIIQGNSEVLALLWGPIAVLLQLAQKLDEAFDSLVSVVAEVGQYLPDFQVPFSVLNRGKETKVIMILFFKDILDFYRQLWQPFTHQYWTHIYGRLWPGHFNNIKEVACHWEQLTRLLRMGIYLENIQQEHGCRKNSINTSSFEALIAKTRRLEYYRIMASLNPCGYNNTLYRLDSLHCQGTGSWLFESQPFLDWIKDSQKDPRRILWLKGIPGAGKIVLSSAIVNHLRQIHDAKTAFAFLTYQETKTSALSTIHSLIFQLAGSDEELMAIVCEAICDPPRRNLTMASDLLASLIHRVGPVYLVLDGGDEISETERGRLVTVLLRLAEESEKLRIIFSARPEADLIRLLDNIAVVINVHEQNEGNIKIYIDQRMQDIFHIRRVFPAVQTEIARLLEPLVSRAKGMFLYARLIMDMVATLDDLSEIKMELAVLPESLDAAYHRIIVRLEEHTNKRRAQKARRLLGWIACTSAPITIEEASQALILKPQDRKQVFNLVANLDVVEILGLIIETVDTYICFVHPTVKEQKHHDSDLKEEISHNVCTGQYTFHAFAVRMWLELVCQYLLAIKTEDPSYEIIDSIRRLWKARKIQEISIDTEDGRIDESEVEDEMNLLLKF
ncbi:hypothetical protein GGR58DRAFT_529608 [Xylaria digitata]|nr:hypothetical protein GGR58DRAFT_529608 [Xylaria digitata]